MNQFNSLSLARTLPNESVEYGIRKDSGGNAAHGL